MDDAFGIDKRFVYIGSADTFAKLRGKKQTIAQSLATFCSRSQGRFVLYLAGVLCSSDCHSFIDMFDDGQEADEVAVTLKAPWLKYGESSASDEFPIGVRHTEEVAPVGLVQTLDLSTDEHMDSLDYDIVERRHDNFRKTGIHRRTGRSTGIAGLFALSINSEQLRIRMKRQSAGRTEAARAAQRIKRASDVAVWAAEEDTAPPLPTAAGRIGIAQLPLPLLRDGVFSYLAPPPSLAQPATMRDGIDARKYEAQLGAIRAVCQRWNRATQQSLAACEKRVQRIRFQTADANDRARILRDAQNHGGDVHELAIVTGTYSGIMWNFTTGKFFCKDELLAATAWWRELLACFPHLERLNLDGVELCFMETVLSVAADVCPRVRGLVFLGGSPVMGRRPEKTEMIKLNRALADALRKWYTANGGLRLLAMPCWARYNDAAHSDVLKAVASFCPDIEYLPTWDYAGITRSNQASPHHVPVAVWRDFCRRCTKLRAFSWNLCEMTPKHVGHFVASKKPHLDSLAIELGIEDWKSDPKFVQIQSALASVPTVRMLTMTFADASDWNEDSDEDTGDDTTAEAEAGCAALDDIVRSVPLHSPKLETFTCKFICDEASVVVGGKAVKTLLGLSSLRRLEIERCKLHENSVDEILSRADASDSTSRVDELDSTDTPHTAIYSVLVNIAEQSVSGQASTTVGGGNADTIARTNLRGQEVNKATAEEEEAEPEHAPPPVRRSSRRSGRS